MAKKRIAVFGSGSCEPGDRAYGIAQEIGKKLAEAGAIVVNGAYGGVMEAASRGAQEAKGESVGIHLGISSDLEPNEYLTLALDCSALILNASNLTIEKAFGVRLGYLLESDRFVFIAGGGVGTLVELFAILNLNLKLWKKTGEKRIALLEIDGQSRWAALLTFFNDQWGLPIEEASHLIHVTHSNEEVVSWVLG